MDTGLLIGLIMAGLFVAIAKNKRGAANMPKPSRIRAFNSNITIETAVKTIITYAQISGYKIDDFNERDHIIVLSDLTSLTSYGYIYLIYLNKQSDNSIQIEIGIKSKSVNPYSIHNDAPLEKCFNGIKASIYAVSAQS